MGGLFGWSGRPPRAPVGAAQHAEGTVVLTAAEAATGVTRTVKVRARRLCTRCQGRAWWKGARCRRCGATGLGRTDRRTLTLRIPAGTRDGTTVRVKRKGTPGVAGVRPAGDLHVRVRLRGTVEPSAAPPTGRPATGGTAAGTAGGTLQSEHVIVTANASGFEVKQCRRVGVWETELTLSWPELRRLSFDTAPHDRVIALYAWTTDGRRRYAFDAGHITRPQWRTLAAYVEQASGGTVLLDLASRDHPHP
ncbi:DnaJ C-terminal domain-containing protein [Streptomyces sp. NPDC048527]|uniref:DnaJ C-terminal domain-containing protein n=1 Tax=Streptomyces sp. NPDC048527 TaxID=3365568 RepID=UPI00370FD694